MIPSNLHSSSMILKPAPQEPHCQVWLPVWNEPQHLVFYLKLLSRSRTHLSLFLSQIERVSGWDVAERTPFLFTTVQCRRSLLSGTNPPFSFITNLPCNVKFSGVVFLFKLHVLYFCLTCSFSIVDLYNVHP